jgi:hypothetical protein
LAFGEEMLARLLSAATGESLAAQDLLFIGERIWNLERLWNNAAGFTRGDDSLPDRILREPHSEGPSAGRIFELEPMLDEYYRARGWNDAGEPSAAKLAALGLEEEADRLGAPGASEEPEAAHSDWFSWRPSAVDDHIRSSSRREPPAPTEPSQGGRHLRAVP